MADIKKKSIALNAFFSFLKAFVTLLSPILTFPYASRILMPEGIGKVNFANSIILYFIILSELGIGKYATREAAKIKNDSIMLTKFAKEILSINLFSTLISYLLFFASFIFIRKFEDYRLILLICSSKILFTTLGMDWLYNGIEEFKYISLRSIFFQILSIAYLFIFVKTKDDYVEYAVFTMISSVGSNILNFIHIRKFISLGEKIPLEFSRHFKYIFTFFGMTLVTSVYEILDTTMLGFLSNDYQTGIYSASTKIIRMTIDMITAISAVFLPRLSKYYSKKDTSQFDGLTNNSFKLISLLALPIMAGIFILTPQFIILFCGTDFTGSILPMRILSMIVIFISVSNLLAGQILPASNMERISMIAFISAAVFNVSFNFMLIPKYGAVGAAFGTTIAEFTAFIVPIIFLRKKIFIKKNLASVLQSAISTSVMAAGILILRHFIPNTILQIAACIFFGAMIYGLSLLALKNEMLLLVLHKAKRFIPKRQAP